MKSGYKLFNFRIPGMFLRLMTSLLVLTVVFPVGIFGASLHRCEMDSSVRVSSCCEGTAKVSPPSDGLMQMSHQCSDVSAPSDIQPATVGQKSQIDPLFSADVSIVSASSIRISTQTCKVLTLPDFSHRPASCTPVFLRTCSFLI